MFALWDWPHVRCRVFDHNIGAGTHMFVHKCSLWYQLMKAPPDICVGTIKASIVSIPAMELAQTSPLVKVRPFSVWSEDRSGKDRPTMTSNIPRISLQSSPHFGHRKGMKDLKWNLQGEKEKFQLQVHKIVQCTHRHYRHTMTQLIKSMSTENWRDSNWWCNK